jgi:hypothetical protein
VQVGRITVGGDPGRMKNRRFPVRLGFAFAGLRLVFPREELPHPEP